MNTLEYKIKIFNFLMEKVKLKIADAESAAEELKTYKNDSTKSSAGDKHETGRAMMQLELDKILTQLDVSNKHIKELLAIDPSKSSEMVVKGSLVITNFESYFISIGTGKLVMDEGVVYAISAHSPLGSQLMNKRVNDTFSFLNRDFIIKEVV